MPYEPQNQKQPAQNNPSSNQTSGKTDQVAGNVKKDEQTAGNTKDKDGNCSTSDKKSTQGGCN